MFEGRFNRFLSSLFFLGEVAASVRGPLRGAPWNRPHIKSRGESLSDAGEAA